MPTYEYECSECGHGLEIFQSMTEKRLTECPECKKEGLQRLIGTGSGVIFKGSGFYETDYKKKDAPKLAPSNETKSESPCSSGCCNKACPANPEKS
ncbi:MAG: zinc ribbon domain-containing protein [Candidatus Aceula meridiana]|nr:zinc ribbon domain-containing protein [Candidatus Aceula meridiana]